MHGDYPRPISESQIASASVTGPTAGQVLLSLPVRAAGWYLLTGRITSNGSLVANLELRNLSRPLGRPTSDDAGLACMFKLETGTLDVVALAADAGTLYRLENITLTRYAGVGDPCG